MRAGLYDSDFVTVKAFGANRFKLTYHCRGVRRAGFELGRVASSSSVMDEQTAGAGWAPSEAEWRRADSSFRRAKATVLELGLCNHWDYFCTLTLDSRKYDRYHLHKWRKDFAQWVRDQRKKWGCAFRYLLIPEPHKDGAWHMHGFFAGIAPQMLQKNQNGYLHMVGYFNKFGFMSLGKLRNPEAAAKYVLKYITKDLGVRKNEYHSHFFYASQGLKRAKLIDKGTISHKNENFWDFRNDFVKIKWLDFRPVICSDKGFPLDGFLSVDNLRIVEREDESANGVHFQGGDAPYTRGIDAGQSPCFGGEFGDRPADWRCVAFEDGCYCKSFFGAGGKDRKAAKGVFIC